MQREADPERYSENRQVKALLIPKQFTRFNHPRAFSPNRLNLGAGAESLRLSDRGMGTRARFNGPLDMPQPPVSIRVT